MSPLTLCRRLWHFIRRRHRFGRPFYYEHGRGIRGAFATGDYIKQCRCYCHEKQPP